MAIFTFKKQQITEEKTMTFSTPFGQIGNGNLSLPYVASNLTKNQMVLFGQDNLYPQLLVQMFYTSPLHNAICNFKTNSVLGGGFELVKDITATTSEDVNLRAMRGIMRLDDNLDRMLLDLIIHARCYFILHFSDDKSLLRVEYIGAEKVRTNEDKSLYYINDDWSRGLTTRTVKPYSRDNLKSTKKLLFCYENNGAGQDIYPLPNYTTALNWAFLDGEMSVLQKEYIVNGIFPSFVMSFPQPFKSEEEKNKMKQTIESGRGARNGGKIITFVGRGAESMPKIDTIPVSQLDNAFQNTTESIDSKICQAHTIDPILMGIRVSGKLGSGSDIKQAYTIYEKNVVMPLRREVENVINTLLNIARVKGKIVINDYQIINEAIVEGSNNEMIKSLNSMNPLVASKVLDAMSEDEVRALVGLKKGI